MAVADGVLIILSKPQGSDCPHMIVRRPPSAGPTLTRIIPATLFAESVELVPVEPLLAVAETGWR